MQKFKINELKIHQEMDINETTKVLRVPGGLIYLFYHDGKLITSEKTLVEDKFFGKKSRPTISII